MITENKLNLPVLSKQPLGDVFYLGIMGTEQEVQSYVNWFYGIKATDAKEPIDFLGNFGFISFRTKHFIRQLAYSWHSKAMELVPTDRYSREQRKRIAWIKAVRMAIQFYNNLPCETFVTLHEYIVDFKPARFHEPDSFNLASFNSVGCRLAGV